PEPPVKNWAAEMMVPSREDYDTSIAYLDYAIGELLDELQRRDLTRSTVIVIASDHGEQFGEHGAGGHGNTLFLELLHVPLVILGPQQILDPATVMNRRVSEVVSLADLPATLLDLLRLKNRVAVLPGKSLARFWSTAHPLGEPVFSDLDIII